MEFNLSKYLIVIILGLVLLNCNDNFNSAPDPPVTNETEILRITQTPNPGKKGEVVKFTCIISDSLKDTFTFTWSTSFSNQSVKTFNNSYEITVNREPGEYSGNVIVDDTTKNNEPVNKNFTIIIN